MLPTSTPEANYIARNNIVLPGDSDAAAAAEAAARIELAARLNVTSVTGGTVDYDLDA